MKHYPYIIRGGTALGAGIAVSLARAGIPSLMLDSGSLPGAEFAAAFAGEPMMGYAARSEAAADLKAELIARAVISERGDNYPALEPVFCRVLNEYHGTVEYLARTAVVSHEYREGRHEIEVHTIGGVYGFTGEHYIDTTAGNRGCTQILAAAVKADAAVADGDLTLVPGCFAGEYFARMAADGMTYAQARTAMMAAWRNRGEALREAQLYYIADQFAKRCEGGVCRTGERAYALPSVSYASALAAFDAGIRLMETNPEVFR